ncbi:MAG TPA: hypothetical protein VFA68_09745 [Terriglobales bacterium]|nr:hypothetical protein [Terriglobales bacterium]
MSSTRSYMMETNKHGSQGFTLIASMLMLLLLSGVAIGLLMMVNTETRVGANDVENSLAYRSAEGAIEQMTSNLATTYQNIQSPQASDITALSALQPTIPGITFPSGGYTLTPRTDPTTGALIRSYGPVKSGPNAGLYAQITPIDLAVTADRPWGEEVRMMRTVEVAQIPVFQFGVFSDSDLAFFNSPTLDFAGRVHTNGDLYLGVSTGATLTFHDKMTAFGNVVRMVLPNGLAVSGNDGNVFIPTASGGCDTGTPACRAMSTSAGAYREGSVVNGPTSGQNGSWKTISTGAAPSGYNGWITDGNYGNPGGTGVKALSLPFVSGNSLPQEIIRRPPKVGQAASAADPSRLGGQAQIRVLLGDNPNDLILSDSSSTVNDTVELASLVPNALLPGGSGWAQNGVTVNGKVYYFGEANTDCTGGKGCDANFVTPPKFHGSPFPGGVKEWPQIDGFLLVEVNYPDGTWHAVTKEWLQLGFARGLTPPTTPGSNTVADHANAILYFQMRADRNGDGSLTNAGDVSTTVTGANSQYNWFPINMYDAREGEVRDWASGAAPGGASSCSVNGVMNVVELDVGNLKRWLKGTIPGTGNQVDYVSQNGYILYFSDRRGMLPDPLAVPPEIVAPNLKGDYGFEDVINTGGGNSGTPDGALEAPVSIKGKNQSPEDTNSNGRLDKYGATNVGEGFGINTNTNPPDPFSTRIANCYTTGRKNRVTGARHVLKLVDGSLGNVPVNLVPNLDGTLGGFTVASENPVYIQGDYNSSSADPTWLNPNASEPAHSAAAVIADTVTLLSNQWLDAGVSTGAVTTTGSLLHPTDATKYRPANTTYYRVAIAAGKTITFPHPSADPTAYFGTDGGLHNFLRFLENWSGQSLYYKGSLVSLFYSTYNTGTFKCCNYSVYEPPVRNYRFDPLFTDPKNLPPGTPMFRDVNNLAYRQDFTPH